MNNFDCDFRRKLLWISCRSRLKKPIQFRMLEVMTARERTKFGQSRRLIGVVRKFLLVRPIYSNFEVLSFMRNFSGSSVRPVERTIPPQSKLLSGAINTSATTPSINISNQFLEQPSMRPTNSAGAFNFSIYCSYYLYLDVLPSIIF